MIVAIYSRKSKFTGKGESIGNQIELCRDYCENNFKYENIDFLIYEDEGFSGKNTDRPEFQRMIKDCKNKKINILICYRLDRISRNVADFSSTLETLQKYDVNFISIREQFDTSTPMGRAMIYIASVFAQLERETIAERVRDNMLELAKAGRWLGGQTPLGFSSEEIMYTTSDYKQKSMHKLSPNKKELEKVKLIFHKYLETGSISLTLKYLLTFNIKGKNGGDFASMSINDILRNPVYVKSSDLVFNYLQEKGMQICGSPNGNGILIYNKVKSDYKKKNISEWITAVGKHKGVIDDTIWLRVQRNLDKNSQKDNPRQGTSKKSLLSGILKCGVCGAPMRISYGRPKKNSAEKIYYYMCTMKAHSGKTRCANPNVRGDILEKFIVKYIKKVKGDLIANKLKLNPETNETNEIKKELELKNIQLNNLVDQLSNVKNDVATKSITSKMDKLGKMIKNLELKLNDAKELKISSEKKKMNVEIIRNALEKFNTTFDTIDEISEKRILIETIINKIEWNGITKHVDITLWGSKNNKSQYNKMSTCLAVRR